MSNFEFLSVQFEYEGEKFYSLVRRKKKINCIEYHITVMNGELEKLLYGNHIIKEINGILQAECLSINKKVAALKQCITKALQKYLSSQQLEGATSTTPAK
jgi:hypothetical protein